MLLVSSDSRRTWASRSLVTYMRRIYDIAVNSSSFPVVMVIGPRQVGKTTMLRTLAASSERRYVSLDEFGPRSLALEDPALFLQRYPAPVLVDEVQHAPALLEHLRGTPRRPGGAGTAATRSASSRPSWPAG